MAKKKENVPEQSENIAEEPTVSNDGGSLPDEIPVVTGRPFDINSVETAKSFVESNYDLAGKNVAYVTSDGQVFWKENANSANNHAVKNNLKLFMPTWD